MYFVSAYVRKQRSPPKKEPIYKSSVVKDAKTNVAAKNIKVPVHGGQNVERKNKT